MPKIYPSNTLDLGSQAKVYKILKNRLVLYISKNAIIMDF